MGGRRLAALLVFASVPLASCGGGGGSTASKAAPRSSNAATSPGANSAPGTSPASTGCPPAVGTTASRQQAATVQMLLTGVDAAPVDCRDVVTFDFRSTGVGTSPGYTIGYQSGPFRSGEGDQILKVNGSAFLVVRFDSAMGADLTKPDAPLTYTGPSTLTPDGMQHVLQIKRISDFEGVLVWAIGLDAKRPFIVDGSPTPPKIVITIS
jgi:hypothetical protein